MNNPEICIPEEIALEVLELASRYYARSTQSYSLSELVQAASEVQIPAEFIEQAIREIETQRCLKQEQQKRARLMRQTLLEIGAGILAGSSLWIILTYNCLIRSLSNVEATQAQVENQLQRRATLIPNSIDVTQVCAKQEQELISVLAHSREADLQALTPDKKAMAVARVNLTLARFRDCVVANPELQTSQLLVNLQYEIAGMENRLAVERMRYNQAARAHNQKVRQFPTSVVAIAFGFETKPLFH